MDFKEYQDKAISFAAYPTHPALNASGDYIPLYPVLALGEEAGEVQGKIAKAIRDGAKYNELREVVSKELGDVLWQLSAVATHFHLDLEDIAIQNIEKLESRKARNVIQGSGDER